MDALEAIIKTHVAPFEFKLEKELGKEVKVTVEIIDTDKNPYHHNTAINNLFKCISEIHGVSVRVMISKIREERIVKARYHLMSILRGMGYSYQYIGDLLGGRNHATILNGVRNHKNLMATDENYRRMVESALSIK